MAGSGARTEGRVGRPPKVDDAGTGTRQRLLDAATAACIEHGFEAATVADIAARANVSAPAIYNHFGGKFELMVAAAQHELDGLVRRVRRGEGRPSVGDVVRAFAGDDFAGTRRLLTELHAASLRHPEVAELLAEWQRAQARFWRPNGRSADVDVKTFFALLLGLCQLDALSAIAGSPAAVATQVADLVATLFPDEESR